MLVANSLCVRSRGQSCFLCGYNYRHAPLCLVLFYFVLFFSAELEPRALGMVSKRSTRKATLILIIVMDALPICLFIYLFLCLVPSEARRGIISPWLGVATWVLGTKSGSSRRAAIAFNHGAISLVPPSSTIPTHKDSISGEQEPSGLCFLSQLVPKVCQ